MKNSGGFYGIVLASHPFMNNAQKMTGAEIYRLGALKLQPLLRAEQTIEFEQLDSKWTLEKIDLVMTAQENLRLPKPKRRP